MSPFNTVCEKMIKRQLETNIFAKTNTGRITCNSTIIITLLLFNSIDFE